MVSCKSGFRKPQIMFSDVIDSALVPCTCLGGEAERCLRCFTQALKDINGDNDELKGQIDDALGTYTYTMQIYRNKAATMTKNDIRQWVVDSRKDPHGVQPQQVLARVIRANELCCHQTPRLAQVIAVILLLQRPSGENRLLQQATGEGKSTTCAMLAVVLALRKKYVDIITSSHVLAKRDAEDEHRRSFFETFGLTVAHNADVSGRSGEASCYSCDVVYGSAHDFQVSGTVSERRRTNSHYGEGEKTTLENIISGRSLKHFLRRTSDFFTV